MSKTLTLNGDSKNLLKMLLQIISATSTDPYYHVSEIVQNEMDAGATNINITFYRRGGTKSGKVKKITIEGNGFGFLESFERYRKNIGDSTKKYFKEYCERSEQGLSRGQFCIGLQGFRAICEEIHIVNKTKKEMYPKITGVEKIDDPDFTKMFSNRKMILRANNLDVEIQEEDEFKDKRETHGVTCSLLYPKIPDLKSNNLINFLSQNKRTELLANKNLKITVTDGKTSKVVKPIDYKGFKEIFELEHPKSKTSIKHRGLGKVRAILYFHEEKSGSKVRLDVKKEPIILDITNLEEFNIPPWNSDCVEGIIEYDRLTKSPLRSGVERDEIFYPAFVDIMKELGKIVTKKVKEYEEKTKNKLDDKLKKKLEKVLGDIKRELEFSTWFNKPVADKIDVGPLDHIAVFPDVANVPANTTQKVHVRAYDSNDKPLKEKDNIKFEWTLTNNLGKVYPKEDGEAIFRAFSTIGATTLEVKVVDLITKKEESDKIEIAITHPPRQGGILSRVVVEPSYSALPLGEEREYKAIAMDEDRNPILKDITYNWEITYDDTTGAEINVKEGESVILKSGKNQGTIKLQVTAWQNNKNVTDFAVITVTERRKKSERKPRTKNLGVPYPEHYNDPTEFPLTHCHLNTKGTILHYNTAHPDYKNAVAKGSKMRQRYIANLYAKELGKIESEATGRDYGEMVLEVLSKIDRLW